MSNILDSLIETAKSKGYLKEPIAIKNDLEIISEYRLDMDFCNVEVFRNIPLENLNLNPTCSGRPGYRDLDFVITNRHLMNFNIHWSQHQDAALVIINIKQKNEDGYYIEGVLVDTVSSLDDTKFYVDVKLCTIT